eukprot:CCRYP_010871-RA/>CCRYP_010871-RA protein AED:0.00 eAED:0.00 QI:11/1/0.5/1/0/0/2/0/86
MVCLYPSERCSDLPKECSLIWGSELPCWGVHAVGRWTLLLGVLRMLHLGFVPSGTKMADSWPMSMLCSFYLLGHSLINQKILIVVI